MGLHQTVWILHRLWVPLLILSTNSPGGSGFPLVIQVAEK